MRMTQRDIMEGHAIADLLFDASAWLARMASHMRSWTGNARRSMLPWWHWKEMGLLPIRWAIRHGLGKAIAKAMLWLTPKDLPK